jgi:5'-nucleotidase
MVDYMAKFASDAPLAVDSTQHAVGVTFPADAPKKYHPRGTVSFDLSSLAFTAPGDEQDAAVQVALGDQVLGTFPVDNTVTDELSDENGTASVEVTLPARSVGPQVLSITGDTTGTGVAVPIMVTKAPAHVSVSQKSERVIVDTTYPRLAVRVTAADAPAAGKVRVHTGGERYTMKLTDGFVRFVLEPYQRTGEHKVVVRYLGNDSTTRDREVLQLTVQRDKSA